MFFKFHRVRVVFFSDESETVTIIDYKFVYLSICSFSKTPRRIKIGSLSCLPPPPIMWTWIELAFATTRNDRTLVRSPKSVSGTTRRGHRPRRHNDVRTRCHGHCTFTVMCVYLWWTWASWGRGKRAARRRWTVGWTGNTARTRTAGRWGIRRRARSSGPRIRPRTRICGTRRTAVVAWTRVSLKTVRYVHNIPERRERAMVAQRHHRVTPQPVGLEFLHAGHEVHDEKLYPEQQVVPTGHGRRRRRRRRVRVVFSE